MINICKALEKGIPLLKTTEWKNDRMHISDLGTVIDGCPRQLWLRLQGAEKRPNKLGEEMMFDAGNRIHDRMVAALTLGGLDVVDSERETSFMGMTGRYDVKLRDGKDIVIADFKTVRGAAFGYLNEPKPSHVAQVLGYVAAEDAARGMIIYVDREGQNGVRVFDLDRNDDEVIGMAEKLKEIAKGDKPPILQPVTKIEKRKAFDTVYLKMPWNCDYCRYIDISCDGALPKDMRDGGIAGRIRGGVYEPENEDVTDVVRGCLGV